VQAAQYTAPGGRVIVLDEPYIDARRLTELSLIRGFYKNQRSSQKISDSQKNLGN